jgi:hypothetical protein
MTVYSTIPAVYREDNTALRYTGDDPYTGTQCTSGPGSVNHTGTGISSFGNGNGMISCPDFELPAMVTSEDFWESALRRERRERESLISALDAREAVVGGGSSSSSSNCVDGSKSSDETVMRSSMRDDEIGIDREGDNMNSTTLPNAPATAPSSSSSSSSSSSGSSRSSEDQEVRNTLIHSSTHPSLPQHMYIHTYICMYMCVYICVFCQSSTPCWFVLSSF